MDSVDPVDSGLARSVVFEGQTENGNDVGIEISFGENNFDFENRDRYISFAFLFFFLRFGSVFFNVHIPHGVSALFFSK